MPRFTHLTAVLLLAVVLTPLAAHAQNTSNVDPGVQPDREFRLVASILGYRGVGADIDGIRNPILQARKGEVVRITIVNGEILTHDIAMEKAGVNSVTIVDEGSEATITFIAEASDTYFCSIPGHRAAGMEGKFQLLEDKDVVVAGRPVLKEGKALNLGFEDGTYQGWTATGDAFGSKPVEGDVVFARTEDIHSQHDGLFWAASNEANTHSATGTLTSVPFTVTAPYISFLVAGGAIEDTRVELVRQSSGEVIFKITGNNSPALRPVVVDASALQGQEIFVRLIDNDTGFSAIPYVRENTNAYIAFDDLRFYPNRPTFLNELDPNEIVILPKIDPIPNAGLSGADAIAAMTLPDGFSITLASTEPEIIRPITFSLDDKGRMWVVEAHTYPVPAPEGQGKDRILIFEDTDGDGKFDERKVFIEGLNLVSGMEIGFGGVWVGAAPYFLYIPIDPVTDMPAGPPQVLLDGWGTQDTHETLNSFRWGPDGWLYGNHGVFTHSKVGVPGTPDEERVGLNAGVWRYHPQRHVFEVFAHGTSNPWGLDFNDYGHIFITACVIPHLYHMIQGGRYQRQGGKHFNPYTYDDIKTTADHVHWVGELGPHAGNHRSGSAGGGHAHVGAMFYEGGSWPEEYHDQLFMHNIHGFRTNVDIPVREGSGYTATHGTDFLLANDTWSQMLNMQYGPDGSVWTIDWYDKNQCHSPNPDVHDKTLGRIFKITHENDRWVQVDMASKTNAELVAYTLDKNDWYVRHARRILQERGADPQVHAGLRDILDNNPDVTRRLRAMWALAVTDGLSDADLTALLDDPSENVRSWALQFLAEDGIMPAEAMAKVNELAANDDSKLVQLYITSALQRLPLESRWDALAGLAARDDNKGDLNLPLMIWYATEPMVDIDLGRTLDLALDAETENLLAFTIRRIVESDQPNAMTALARALEKTDDPEKQAAIIKGLNDMMGGTH